MRRSLRCPDPASYEGRVAMPGPASQALRSHEVVAICCSVLAWQITTTFLRYRAGNGRDSLLCFRVANHDHFLGLFKRKMVAKCHVCTEWHFATAPRDHPTGPPHGTAPRDHPSGRDEPCSKVLSCVRDGLPSLTSRMPPPWQRRPRGACWPRGRSWARSGSRRCRR